MKLKNKVVFITGASSGIGEASAHAFAEQGARLILAARNYDKLQTLASHLQQQYQTSCYSIQLDVSNADEVTTKLTQLPTEFSNIDILLNNAGVAHGVDKIPEGDFKDWDRMIDTNIKGLLYVTQLVIKKMVTRNTGHIINIGSISSHQVYPGGSVYCATKFAVKAISRGIKMDVHGTSIRVTELDPGMVYTNYSLNRFAGDQAKADAVYTGLTPLSAEDIADAAVYCATRPAHVNIAEMLILPVAQTAAHMVHRQE